MKSFDDMYTELKHTEPVGLIVAAAEDEDVLCSVKKALDYKLIKPILTGDKDKIIQISKKISLDTTLVNIVGTNSNQESIDKAMELIKDGYGQVLMKGHIGTSDILKGVLKKSYGLKDSSLLSHLAVFQIKNFDRPLLISDIAMNISPDVDDKEMIINNAVSFANIMGYKCPHVGAICAVENVNEKMQSTIDAAELVNRYEKGIIKNCTVSGPFALDNALSLRSARIKGIKDPYAGKIDILIMPDIEAGNILYKGLTYLTECKTAGIIIGAKIPVVLTSRSDTSETKLNSIALAIYASSKLKIQ